MRIKIPKSQTVEIDFWVNNSQSSKLEKYREWILKRTDLNSTIALEFIQFFKEEWEKDVNFSFINKDQNEMKDYLIWNGLFICVI